MFYMQDGGPIDIRGEQKNWKIDYTEKTGKKIIEKTESWKKTD
jgi:hypothetical protein